MKAIAMTAAMIRVCAVRWTFGPWSRRAALASHRSASDVPRPELADQQHHTPLKMKKAERSGVRKELPPARSSIRTGTSSTRSPWRTASCSDSISAKSGE